MITGKGIKKVGMIAFLLIIGLALPAHAQKKAPPKLQAALFLKLLSYYTNLGSGPFTIHVVNSAEVAKELRGMKGKTVGKATLADISESAGAPTNDAKVIYVGDSVQAMIGFSQANKRLTITGDPAFVSQGVTLGVAIEAGKPKILLNLSSTKAEAVNWNPAILKVASTVE